MKKWLEPHAIEVPQELQEAVGGHPLVAQVLARRGILTADQAASFLDPGCYTSAPPTELPGMEQAAERIKQAIQRKEPICIWGDFDVDGQTSTTILFSTLEDLGAEVNFHIPVRELESHGVNLPALKAIIEQGARLILTCDTGITAHAAVDYSRSQGVDFIITDHHALPPELPAATAIVNSRQLSEGHPLGTLSGAGVAFKLAEELYRQTGREGEAEKLVDLAALGIVADLATQVGEARYLVQKGLQSLRKTQRLGIQVMLEVAELNPTNLTEAHIGFELAPRLNALGRLSDATISVEFFTTQDPVRARVIATTLEGLNARRQLLTTQVFQAALAQVDKDPPLLEGPVLVLAHPAWPAGVIGIVASHLVERFNRPVVLLSDPPGVLARGSARSVEGCDITAAIATQQNLLSNFGGHPMAAGLGIKPELIPEFGQGLSRAVAVQLGEQRLEPVLQIDGYLPLSELSLDLAEDFQRLAPFGPGNPALVLAAKDLAISSSTPIGRNGEHLQVIVQDVQGSSHKVVWWQGAGWDLPQGRFDLAFTVQASDFRGVREVQIEWVDARPVEKDQLVALPAAKFEVVDYRQQPYPLAVLKQLALRSEVQVWCEGEATERLKEAGITGLRREMLETGRELVIWTTPPGWMELKAVIERVAPEVIDLFCVDPEASDADAFLKRLAGLVKYSVKNYQGNIELTGLASATAQSEVTVRKGLEWLATRGFIKISEEEKGMLQLEPGSHTLPPDPRLTAQLEALLQEARAFRAFCYKAENLFK